MRGLGAVGRGPGVFTGHFVPRKRAAGTFLFITWVTARGPDATGLEWSHTHALPRGGLPGPSTMDASLGVLYMVVGASICAQSHI